MRIRWKCHNRDARMMTTRTISSRENLLRVLRRDHPAWVPNGLEARARILPPLHERPPAAGQDAFGVEWSYLPEAEGGTYPTEGGHTVSDIRKWRQEISIPDIDKLDWSATR